MKKNKVNIGIVGKGFVGSAVVNGFSNDSNDIYNIRIYDVNPDIALDSLESVVNESDIVFISVPTPSFEDGEINLEILDSCLKEISGISINKETIFLIRSTVVPGTSRKFQSKYRNINLVFNPEFLTEKNANNDFLNQERVILGGESNNISKVADLYRLKFGSSIKVIETDFESAELIKYISNTFLASKVSFMNEMKILSDKVNANWDDVVSGFILDSRVGSSHVDVPGHDGKLGFGGSCFPKDIQALIHFSKSLGIEMNMLEAAWKTNLKVRSEKDWEKLHGRAISKRKNNQ